MQAEGPGERRRGRRFAILAIVALASWPLSRRCGSEPLAPGRVAPATFGSFARALEAGLAEGVGGPALRELVAAFLAKPGLRALYDEFAAADESGEHRTIREFAQRLRQAPEFWELAVRFGSRPDFIRAALALRDSPAMRPLVEDMRRSRKESAGHRVDPAR